MDLHYEWDKQDGSEVGDNSEQQCQRKVAVGQAGEDNTARQGCGHDEENRKAWGLNVKKRGNLLDTYCRSDSCMIECVSTQCTIMYGAMITNQK